MDQNIAEHAAEVLKALAHPVRLQIVSILQHGERCVGDIVTELGAKNAITSQQLSMMKSRGILASRKDGAKVFYRINNANITKLLECISANCESKRE